MINKKEPMMTTWGRIRSRMGYSSVIDNLKDERLKVLIDKFQKDLDGLSTEIIWEK